MKTASSYEMFPASRAAEVRETASQRDARRPSPQDQTSPLEPKLSMNAACIIASLYWQY
jgi:hypothetical protein